MSPSKRPEDRSEPVAPAGRVKHDASGRAIWEWAVDTGRHALDSTSRLLKRLEMPGLALEDDDKKNKAGKEDAVDPVDRDVPTFGGKREADPLATRQRSFNPYDNKLPMKSPPVRSGPAKTTRRITQPPPPAKKPGFFARLFGRKG
jgi:hypothetical protein